MKKAALISIVCVMIMIMYNTTFAALGDFLGYWRNIDNSGVTTLYIIQAGNNISVSAWGKCVPTDCYWGNVPGTAYAPSVTSNLNATARAITAIFYHGFAERIMIIHSISGNYLQVEVMTRFTDGSGRTSFNSIYTFARNSALVKLTPVNFDKENESNLSYDSLNDENSWTDYSIPGGFELEQNYPNPFNSETEIRYKIPEAETVTLKIYNDLGQEIHTLVDTTQQAGSFNARWDGKDDQGNSVASGLYFYYFKAGNFSIIKKMSLVQ